MRNELKYFVVFVIILGFYSNLYCAGFRNILLQSVQPDSTTGQFLTGDSLNLGKTNIPFKISPVQVLDDSLIVAGEHNNFELTKIKNKYINIKNSLLFISIAANWTSFYLKGRADNNYDSYKKAGGASSAKHYYQKTKQFDDYASAVLIISGVTFTIYLYYMLTD